MQFVSFINFFPPNRQNIEFSPFAAVAGRTIRASGTLGELRGSFEKEVIEIHMQGEVSPEVIEVPFTPVGHGGGDDGLLRHFVDVVRRGAADEVLG